MFIYSASQRLWWTCICPTVTILLLSTSYTVAAGERFTVTTTPDQLISLKADKSSLKAVVEQIAHELKIELQAKIGDDEKITDEFKNLPLERALKRLSRNYVTVTEKTGGKIAKIFLLPQGHEAPRIVTKSRPPATTATTKSEQSTAQQPQSDSMTATSLPSNQEAVSANQGNASVGNKPGRKTTEATKASPEPFKFEFDPSQYNQHR